MLYWRRRRWPVRPSATAVEPFWATARWQECAASGHPSSFGERTIGLKRICRPPFPGRNDIDAAKLKWRRCGGAAPIPPKTRDLWNHLWAANVDTIGNSRKICYRKL